MAKYERAINTRLKSVFRAAAGGDKVALELIDGLAKAEADRHMRRSEFPHQAIAGSMKKNLHETLGPWIGRQSTKLDYMGSLRMLRENIRSASWQERKKLARRQKDIFLSPQPRHTLEKFLPKFENIDQKREYLQKTFGLSNYQLTLMMNDLDHIDSREGVLDEGKRDAIKNEQNRIRRLVEKYLLNAEDLHSAIPLAEKYGISKEVLDYAIRSKRVEILIFLRKRYAKVAWIIALKESEGKKLREPVPVRGSYTDTLSDVKKKLNFSQY